MIGMRGDELLGGDHERSYAPFHVGSTAPVQHAIADLWGERVAGPGFARAGWHHVSVAQQDQYRCALAMGRPQIVDIAQAQVVAVESSLLQGDVDNLWATH